VCTAWTQSVDDIADWRTGTLIFDDTVFRDLVIARIVEPTSKADAARVLTVLSAETVSYRTIQRHLEGQPRQLSRCHRGQMLHPCR
jgi:hypothetical protein